MNKKSIQEKKDEYIMYLKEIISRAQEHLKYNFDEVLTPEEYRELLNLEYQLGYLTTKPEIILGDAQ